MDKSEWGVHESHCCVLHGCKYGDDDCPVANRQTKQDYPCETCGMFDGIHEVPDPDHPDYDILKMGDLELRDEVRKLRTAIRSHRDEKGMNRCQRDDLTLYSALPESGFVEADMELPPAEIFIPGCVQYWLNRQPKPNLEGVPVACRKVLELDEIKNNPEATAFLHSLQKLIMSVVDAKEKLEAK